MTAGSIAQVLVKQKVDVMSMKILLIEDNSGDTRLVHEMLKSQKSFSLSHVSTMQEAETFLAGHEVDLVLLDQGLPDVQGSESIRRVNAAAPRKPIVMITGRDDELMALQALHEGAQDYLVKGHFEGHSLLRAMRYAIERSRSDEELSMERQRSQEGWVRLAAIHEATPDLVSISDPDGRMVYLNPGGRKMLGVTEDDDILKYRIADFLRDAENHTLIVDGLPGAERDGTWRGVSELVTLDGRSVEISQIILAHKQSDGSVEFFSTIGRDVTDHNRANAALLKSEARLRRLLDSNIIGVVFWDEHGDILSANGLFLKMTGYSLKEIVSLRWVDLTPAEYVSADGTARAEMLATGTCLPFEQGLICKDGSHITVLVSSALLEETVGLGSSFVMDITSRKAAEARVLLQSAALNAAANAIVILDRDFRIVWINASYTLLSGFSEEEAIGRQPRDLFEPSMRDTKYFDDLEATLHSGEVWSGETIKSRKDGSLYPEAQTITPLRDEQGEITHFISIKSDLTERKRIEAQLRQAHKMEAVGQLAAGVAHEFNNLLQGLMSMATLTRLRAATPEAASIGADMEAQIRRGAGLTQQLLLFSRSQEIDKVDLDLEDQIQKAGMLVSRLIPENIVVLVETTGRRISTRGDEGQIQQVLLNLAINARDAMPAGGTLTLRAGSLGDEVFLEVVDTGEGIDERTRAHLFEPFFTTKETGRGTGLGLAVVQGIVTNHEGRIEVNSRPGEGCRFRVILQATPFAIASPPPLPVQAEPSSGTGHVLLVEDEETVREGITELLKVMGYEVTAVGSGEEALAVSFEPAPDFLLCDITLPGMGGADLGNLLGARWPGLKIVLMSGYFSDESRLNADGRGWYFLQKPFEMDHLASGLRAV
ncbi:MAG TPA: PAS domain S-box protein [Thermoanaerobaculia bacterium]|jgi:PAS domain S-box-containing protein|nr:PAS domain S-box protein [Thermoanaerobaculia bacterium]